MSTPDGSAQEYETTISSPADKISLLGVYATQFGSYTTLVWQVPALSLTAQSFLMVIALGHSSDGAMYLASGLSILISVASWRFMHDQRGHAINHGELASKMANGLGLQTLSIASCNDAVPHTTNGEEIWKAVDHLIYAAWGGLMLAFGIADTVIIA